MKRISKCRQCGRHKDDVGRISCSGLCPDCGAANFRANAEQLAAKSGPAFGFYNRRHREGVARWLASLEAQAANQQQHEQ